MDHQKLYEQLLNVERHSQAMTQEIQQMKSELLQLVDENSNLKIENSHLREKIDMIEHLRKMNNQVPDETIGISNLDKLYQSGVHICHTFYGARREEMCLLCESLLEPQKNK